MNTKYDPIIFCQQESLDLEDYVVCTYIMTAQTSDLLMRAGALAIEQTTGTWAPVPDETPEVRRNHVGRVIGVWPVPGYEFSFPTADKTVVMQIAFPWKNFGQNFPEMLSTIFGNIAASDRLKLTDIQFPKKFTAGFPGPKFGIQGLRDLLGIPERPPILAMIKPCTGIPIDVIERQFFDLAVAGVDIIKDDELIADPAHAPFEQRLEACLRAGEKAYRETGKRVLYFPNITDRQDMMFAKAKKAIAMGAQGLMLNAHASGYGCLSALSADPEINVPLLAHPAFCGTYAVGSENGLSSHLILGKFMRLEGADLVVCGCSYGKLPIMKERYIRIVQALRSKFHDLKPTFPCPAAGVHPGMIPTMMKDVGNELVIGAGAGIHAHPGGMKAGIDALKQAAEATMKGVSLEDYALEHEELRQAIEAWGIYDPKQSIFELTT